MDLLNLSACSKINLLKSSFCNKENMKKSSTSITKSIDTTQ
jgi:hypothetical protein